MFNGKKRKSLEVKMEKVRDLEIFYIINHLYIFIITRWLWGNKHGGVMVLAGKMQMTIYLLFKLRRSLIT